MGDVQKNVEAFTGSCCEPALNGGLVGALLPQSQPAGIPKCAPGGGGLTLPARYECGKSRPVPAPMGRPESLGHAFGCLSGPRFGDGPVHHVNDGFTLGKTRGRAGLVRRWVGNRKTKLPGKGLRCNRKWSLGEGGRAARGRSWLRALPLRVLSRPRDRLAPQSERDARC